MRSIEIKRAQIRLYPNLAPATEHMVIVPGPIKAAAITEAGPIFFNLYLILLIILNI